MHVDVPRVEYHKLIDDRPAESSAVVRERVVAVRELQRRRFAVDEPEAHYAGFRFDGAPRGARCNGEMNADDVRRFCRPTREGADLLQAGMRQLGLSARAFHRVLKLARTIADLEGVETIDVPQLAEALQYRPREVG